MVWDKEEIRKFRQSLGFSQKRFAEEIGISRQQTVSAWETGFHVPQGISRRLLDILKEKHEPKAG